MDEERRATQLRRYTQCALSNIRLGTVTSLCMHHLVNAMPIHVAPLWTALCAVTAATVHIEE